MTAKSRMLRRRDKLRPHYNSYTAAQLAEEAATETVAQRERRHIKEQKDREEAECRRSQERHDRRLAIMESNMQLARAGRRTLPIFVSDDFSEFVRGNYPHVSDHLPTREEIPQDIWDSANQYTNYKNLYVAFVVHWFHSGLSPEDLARVKPREFINKNYALRVVGAILRTMRYDHHHKTAGCAFLLQEWFEIIE